MRDRDDRRLEYKNFVPPLSILKLGEQFLSFSQISIYCGRRTKQFLRRRGEHLQYVC